MGAVLSAKLGGEAGAALITSCMEGDSIAAGQMLKSNQRLAVWTSWADGSSPLHAAVGQGHTDLVRDILLAARAYLDRTRKPKTAARAMAVFVNLRSTLGQTPLEVACKLGHSEMVSLLLAHGADALLQDTVHSRTCLHYAAIHGHAACIDILLSESAMVCRAGQATLLRDARLADGKQLHRYVDAPAALGFAPLHLAVGHGHLRATQALLRGGAAPDVRCKGHLFLTYAPPGRYKPMSTPLHIAAFCQSLPLAHSILSQQVHSEDTQDLRAIADCSGQMAHELVENDAALTALLTPGTPLAQALEASAEHMSNVGTRAPHTLAYLAANALRGALLADLEKLPARQRPSLMGTPRTPRTPLPVHDVLAGVTEALTPRRVSKEWPLMCSEEEECEICFMQAADCRMPTCTHTVCRDCAQALCGAHPSGHSPACPFCRSLIGGFQPQQAARHAFVRKSV